MANHLPAGVGIKEHRTERFYPERQHDNDFRSPFQRDRDRILYSAALRRLANVTQVVPAGEDHTVHNRLTHSLKVAQVARRFAERFLIQSAPDVVRDIDLDPDVVEAAALAHDLGHPPFGHVGEEVLNKCLQRRLNIDGFEGNAQSFRIVTRLESSRPNYHGMNLTRATLRALMKYPWMRCAGRETENKWGVYTNDAEVFQWVGALGVGIPGVGVPAESCRAQPSRTLEADIMDLADDITYSVHDMDDFYRAGVLPLNELVFNRREREKFFAFCCDCIDLTSQGFCDQDIRRAFDDMFQNCPPELQTPFRGNIPEQGSQVQFVSRLIGKFSRSFRLSHNEGNIDLAAHKYTRLSIKILKQMMHFYVYDHPSLAAQQHGERRLLKELFDIIYDATGSDKDINILAPRHKSLVEYELNSAHSNGSSNETRLRSRLTADIISSFSESEAITLYHQLTGVSVDRQTHPPRR